MIQSKLWKASAALLVATALIAGCTKDPGGSKPTTPEGSSAPKAATETKKVPDPVTLQFYFMGNPPVDQQSVLDEFYNRTKDTLNIKLNFNWVLGDQFKEKIGLKLASGEQVDAVFDAQWNTMSQMIAKNTYMKLDSYFNNDKYPGLKKAFPASYIENNKFVDGSKEMHVYGVPFTQNFSPVATLIIRKDLRVKYGMPEIKTLQDVETFFDHVLKNEKGMVPFGVNGARSEGLGNWLQTFSRPDNYAALLANGLLMNFAIKNGKVDVVFHGEDISALPAPYNMKDSFYVNDITARKWYQKGYLEKDIISQKDARGFFKAGKFAAVGGDSGVSTLSREIAKAIPGGEIEYVSIQPGVSEWKPGSLTTDFKAWNFSSIPVSSKHADRVMAFFDWLFADQKNHDLFEHGIQGKHWVPVGNDKFKLPDGADPTKVYTLPGYVLTWNPAMVRYPEDFPESAKKLELFAGKPESFRKSATAGFSLDSEPIKSELAKVGPEFLKVRSVASLGLADNYEELYKEAIDKMKSMGLEKIRAEVKKQLEDYLASQKK